MASYYFFECIAQVHRKVQHQIIMIHELSRIFLSSESSQHSLSLYASHNSQRTTIINRYNGEPKSPRIVRDNLHFIEFSMVDNGPIVMACSPVSPN